MLTGIEAALFVFGSITVTWALGTGFGEKEDPMKVWITLGSIVLVVAFVAAGFIFGFTARITVGALVASTVLGTWFHHLDEEGKIARQQYREYRRLEGMERRRRP